MTNDRFFEASKKEQRKMLERIMEFLIDSGFKDVYLIKGSAFPRLGLNVPRGKKRRDGGQSYISFEISAI